MDKFLSFLSQIAQIVALVTSIIGITLAVKTYRHTAKLKRAEWLKSLFEKFYETNHYKEIRQLIDNDKIQEVLAKEELLVDYLNFFEFIATLKILKQLEFEEIEVLFEYYLRLLKKSKDLSEYINKNGFENLNKLLQEFN